MTEIPQEIANIIKSGDLRPLRAFCTLYRNKWNADTSKFENEAEGIDISDMIVKRGTLSKTLDIGEINRFEANNVTLTLSDPKGLFTEDAPNSLFSGDYQIYGSSVALFVGISQAVKTQLFTGIIKELPIYKPDEYQLDLRIVSPLELLRDIETKDFSDKITGETLALDHQEEEENPFYRTAQTGVGGIEAVYANGVKLFEDVDYKVSQTNELSNPAIIEITNADLFGQTFTADYFIWMRNLTVEEILTGLLTMSGYTADKLQIQPVTWNSGVRNQFLINNPLMALAYKQNNNDYIYTAEENSPIPFLGYYRQNIFPDNFKVEFEYGGREFLAGVYALGEFENPTEGQPPNVSNGIIIDFNSFPLKASWIVNSAVVNEEYYSGGNGERTLAITKQDNNVKISIYGIEKEHDIIFNPNSGKFNECSTNFFIVFDKYKLSALDENGNEIAYLNNPGIISEPIRGNSATIWSNIKADLAENFSAYNLYYRLSSDGTNWGEWQNVIFEGEIAQESNYIQIKFELLPPSDFTLETTDVNNFILEYLGSGLRLNFIDLSGQTVLEAIEDFALISGYEFGLDRLGNFFFRPRLTSNIPTAVLDGTELVKIGNIQKKLNNFFTKLVLLFGATPLEFYANEGDRPTLIDRYGVLTKEIDRPQIVNYDNPELAQAIGPQLLSVYSSLKNQISATAKLNLSLDLGDIVNLKRELPLTVNPQASDFTKYENLNTYYRACKIIGLSYDFDKRQVKYTLQDVSDNNTKPQYEFNQFKYLMPVAFGVKE